MKDIPMLDPRKAEDILKAIQQKARIYTPEWKYEPDVMDGGAALAELFAFMFGETIDRLNQVPYKHYIEFLNLMEVSTQSITTATGIAGFNLTEGFERNVVVKKGTQLYCDLKDNLPKDQSSRVIFETVNDFNAVAAKLTGLYSVNPRKDIIEKLDMTTASVKFFDPAGGGNMQRHVFALSSTDTINLVSPAIITLNFENTSIRYRHDEYIARLADPAFAQWSFFDGSKQVPFDRVFVDDSKLQLVKDNLNPLRPQKMENIPDEVEQRWISCTMLSDGQAEEIEMNQIDIGSSYLHKEKKGVHIRPDLLYANDLAIDFEDGGYCFGMQLMPYNCFYFSSEEVFSKRSARINVDFELKTVVKQVGSAQLVGQYDFYRKYVVEKSDIPVPRPDNIYISRLVWEYWNGNGWAHLKVEGDLNPFQPGEGVFRKSINFECPEDMARSLQNSIEGYWIRARVIEVENAFSPYANLNLPFVESISLDYDYKGSLQPVERVYTENNCLKTQFHNPNQFTYMKIFEPMKENVHGVYLAFDLPPAGYPLNLYFKTEGQGKTKCLLNIEYLTQDVKGDGAWRELRFNDRTEALSEDGIISIYAPRDFKKQTLFAQESYWLRLVDKNLKYNERTDFYPLIRKIVPNVVEIVQQQTVSREMFLTTRFEPNKTIHLVNHPIIECQLWVNEISDISQAERSLLLENMPEFLDIQYNNAGHISEFWVKWDKCESFFNSDGNSRHYRLDCNSGKISFGNGRKGKVPSQGPEANIRVKYTFGGGKRGNLPENSIEGMVINIPYVEKVTNLEMTCGGRDRQDLKTLERVGPKKLRHQGRAVTVSDYESIVLEQFSEVKDVKCVANYNRQGAQAWGYVTLVIMPDDIENRMYSLKLSKKIEQYLNEVVSCELLVGGRFSVLPAIVMKVSVSVSVVVENYDLAAETEQEIVDSISGYLSPGISGNAGLKIEEIPTVRDFYNLLKKIRNIIQIREVILEGHYYEGNDLRIVPLDTQFRLRYVVVADGEHLVKIL